MADKTPRREVAVEPLSERDLSRWKLVEDFRRRLVEAQAKSKEFKEKGVEVFARCRAASFELLARATLSACGPSLICT